MTHATDLINMIDYGATPDEQMAMDMTRRAASLDRYAVALDNIAREDITKGTALEAKGEAMAAKGTQDYAALKQGIDVPTTSKKTATQRIAAAYRMRAEAPKLAIEGRRMVREGRKQLADAEKLVREAKRLRKLAGIIDKAIARGVVPVLPPDKRQILSDNDLTD